ncbi:MAG: EF-P beta-lysylation protein EpmB, partial [Planctomycetota bacterium]
MPMIFDSSQSDAVAEPGDGAAMTAAGRPPTLAAAGDDASACQPPPAGSWQAQLAAAIRDPLALLAALDLSSAGVDVDSDFPLMVPAAYLARMRPGDRHDPLLRQVLPLVEERRAVAGFGVDPVGESSCAAGPGLLRKYRGRALLVTTAACAIHCRYCFRRHYPYHDTVRRGPWWTVARDQVAADDTIDELILSGGDPMVLSTAILRRLVEDFLAVPHLRRLRIHTRLPVVLPDRVDDELVAWLSHLPLPVVLVIHANHPAEIDDAVIAACRRLQAAGVVLLNQAVLLAGVNDDVATQEALGQRLVAAGVVPYYLHQLDPVAGAAHFAVDDVRARALQAALQA